MLGEWNRLGPAKPILLAESGYEHENNDGRGGSPQRVRRQAYGSVLTGSLGGHAFGHRDLWQINAHWRQALESTAGAQMAHVRQLFASRAWWRLVPDQWHRLVVEGYGFFNETDYITAALSDDGSLGLVYFPVGKTVTVDLGKLHGPVTASWFDPTNGAMRLAEGVSTGSGEDRRFTPPSPNQAGDGDWVLVLERSK